MADLSSNFGMSIAGTVGAVLPLVSPVNQRQYAILFLVILTFVFPVALHAAARTSNTGTVTRATVIGNGTQAVSASSAVAAPVISCVLGGTYSSAQAVTISDATPGATNYYTTNGTTPTTSSTKYSGPIPVSSSETLEAIAVESVYTNRD